MYLKKLIFLFFSLTFTLSLYADMDEAKELFIEADCMSCHNEVDFTVIDRKGIDFKTMHQKVTACAHATDTSWFDDETLDVTKYLNNEYYFYEEPMDEE